MNPFLAQFIFCNKKYSLTIAKKIQKLIITCKNKYSKPANLFPNILLRCLEYKLVRYKYPYQPKLLFFIMSTPIIATISVIIAVNTIKMSNECRDNYRQTSKKMVITRFVYSHASFHLWQILLNNILVLVFMWSKANQI